MNKIIAALFSIFVALTVFMAKLTIGLPVRSLFLIACIALLAIFYPRYVLDFLQKQYATILLIVAFGVLGASLSVIRGAETALIVDIFNQVIVQVVLTMLCVYVVSAVIGPKFPIYVLMVCTAITGVVAMAQFAGIDAAWNLRLTLADIQGEPYVVKLLVARKDRAIGLSITTMNLAYQLVASIIAFYTLSRAKLISARHFNCIAVFILAASIACEVRSLVLGVLLAIGLFNFRDARIPPARIAIMVIGVGVLLAGISLAESRLARADDGSAVGRYVLLYYGLLLFLENPFGHGWGFDSKQHFWIFWSQLMDLKNASAVYSYGLHNYLINFAVDYGVIGIMLIGLVAAANLSRFLRMLLVFSPYLLNSFFHNGGPFNGEIFFWFAMSSYLYMQDQQLLERTKPRRHRIFGRPVNMQAIAALPPAHTLRP